MGNIQKTATKRILLKNFSVHLVIDILRAQTKLPFA